MRSMHNTTPLQQELRAQCAINANVLTTRGNNKMIALVRCKRRLSAIRELKQLRRRRQRERHLTIGFN